MGNMQLEVAVHDTESSVGFALLDDAKSTEESLTISGGIVVHGQPVYFRKSADFPQIFSYLLEFARDVAPIVVGAAVYDWLKARLKRSPQKITIDGQEVELDREQIERAVQKALSERDDR